MCSGMNHKRIDAIREAERQAAQIKLLRQRLDEAFANDKSHVRSLSQNE